MRARIVGAVFALLLSVSLGASAGLPATFAIVELFSNADGTVQFVQIVDRGRFDCDSGEDQWAGETLVSTGPGPTRTFTFPTNLPSCATSARYVLIATQGFADLGIVVPDYVIPNGFLQMPAGTVNFAQVSQVTYNALPNDGVRAITNTGLVIPNRATNFTGASGSVAPVSSVAIHQHGLTGSWYEPATSGQGFEVEIFPDQTAPGAGAAFLSWFTFDAVAGGAERQRWYTLAGPVSSGTPRAALTIYRNTGGNFNAPPVTSATPVGTATLSFASCTSGQLDYEFTDGTNRNGTIALTRLTQSVTCAPSGTGPTDPDFALSGNWYDPATSGQGLTVEVNAASGTVFAAWYTYAPSAAAAGAGGQRWYTAQASAFAAGSRTIALTLYETTGGVFDAPTAPTTRAVGSGTLVFHSCTAATFGYRFTDGSSAGASGTIALSRVGPVPRGCTS